MESQVGKKQNLVESKENPSDLNSLMDKISFFVASNLIWILNF